MDTRPALRLWRLTLPLILLLLSGCAAQPVELRCVYPQPPEALMVPPAQETYRSRLEKILEGSFSTSQTKPTAKP